MIARIWRGVVRPEHVGEYIDYIAQTGGGEYKQTAGNLGAWTMSRTDGDRAEIIALSFWESWDAIRNFTGPDVEHQVLYPEDERYLLETPTLVHYEVAG